jgi:5-methylcytosine-specific restriction endonuclease McrA
MTASLTERWNGGVCYRCGARRNLLVIWSWRPAHTQAGFASETYTWPARLSVRARCFDQAACEARVDKRNARARVRASCIVLEEPTALDAALGTCRWCGEPLTGLNGSRRNYCYPDREGRDCVASWNASRTYDARVAVRRRDRAVHGCVRCVDCNTVCEGPDPNGGRDAVPWEADHEVALEDGGSHGLDNLVCRCVSCHQAKTARENSVRAARRRAIAEAQEMVDAGQVSLLEATFIADVLPDDEAA